jgi:HEAT repeat protein
MNPLFGLVLGLFMLNVASALVVIFLRSRSNGRARRFGRIESYWEPVIIKVIGDSNGVVPPVPASEARHVLEIAGRFARRLRGPDRDRVQVFCAPYVGLMRKGLSSRSAEKRAAAVELLSVLALETHADDIVGALDDRSPRVSLVAAKALSNPHCPEYTPTVLDHLHRYSGWSSSLVSRMLAQVGAGALGDLRNYLGDIRRPTSARAVVAGALEFLSDPVSAPIAAEALGSADPDLVVACLRLLNEVGGPAQAGAVRALTNHPAFFVRSTSTTVLGRIGDEADVASITAMVYDKSPWVAIRSAGALLALGHNEILEDLAAGRGLAADCARETLSGALVR